MSEASVTEAGNYEQALKGGRGAPSRRLLAPQSILGILSEAGDHPYAMEIFRRAVKIDSRHLAVDGLPYHETAGRPRRHPPPTPSRVAPRVLSRPATSTTRPPDRHRHGRCHRVPPPSPPPPLSDKIEELQAEIARALGYEIVHHRLELYGRKAGKRR